MLLSILKPKDGSKNKGSYQNNIGKCSFLITRNNYLL